jgi:heat shock protein HslJ
MRNLLVAAGALAAIAGAVGSLGGCVAKEQQAAPGDYRNAEYVLDGRRIQLNGGVAESEAAPGSAAKIVTRYFGNEVEHDFNGDGRNDVVFLLTHETGGSGVFYYVVAALATEQGYAGSQGLLLGDRIAPQTTEIGANNIITVNYADRAPGDSFATPPSVGTSIRLLLDTKTLQFGEVAQDFEGEANPATMKLDMQTWAWINARYGDGREVSPRQANVFTLAFGADGTFSATTDCNRLGGKYVAAVNELTFGDVFATRMYCDGSQEGEFAALLETVSSYRFTSRGQLILTFDSGNGSAEFR